MSFQLRCCADGALLSERVPALEGGEHAALFTHVAEIRARVGPFLRRYGLARVS